MYIIYIYFLIFKFIFAFSIFIALVLGNLVPVYPVYNDTNDGTHVSMHNQKKAIIVENGVLGIASSKQYAEQIIAFRQHGNEHCPAMSE